MKKALIPAAGLGTRMFPATKAVKKELLPIITPDGVCKPILQTIVEEAVAAGCDDVAIIVRPADKQLLADFFAPPTPEYYARLPKSAQLECDALTALGKHVTFLLQTDQQGFGHAVYCAREWADGQPVILMNGDHVYFSNTDQSCAQQMISAFESRSPHAVVSLFAAPGASVCHYGTLTGRWLDAAQRLLDVSEFAEKPSHDYAQAHLAMPGMTPDTYLCVYGQYILTPDVFDILGEHIRQNKRSKGEFQLTTALEELRQTRGLYGYLVDGEHFDTGQPKEYLASIIALANKHAR